MHFRKTIWLLTTLMITCALYAQDDPDSIINGGETFLESLLFAPVLGGDRTAVLIRHNQRHCFDKLLEVKVLNGGVTLSACLFINTTEGIVASTPAKPGALANCNLPVSHPDFSLFLVGMKGNTYNFFNVKKKDRLEHWISSANTENYQFQFLHAPDPITLTRRAESLLFFDGTAKAWAYKADGRQELWWIISKTEPETILMTPKKYLGNYAVGFQHTDKGIVLIAKVTSTSYTAEITTASNRQTCFDLTGFELFEDMVYNRGMTEIANERERLSRELGRVQTNTCSEIQVKRIRFQQQSLANRQENLQRGRVANLQQDIGAQQAMLQVMLPHEEVIQLSIFENEHKICRLQQSLAQSSGSQSSSRHRQQERLRCLQGVRVKQIEIQQKIREVNRQFPNDPGKQYVEKSKLMLKALDICD